MTLLKFYNIAKDYTIDVFLSLDDKSKKKMLYNSFFDCPFIFLCSILALDKSFLNSNEREKEKILCQYRDFPFGNFLRSNYTECDVINKSPFLKALCEKEK